MASVRIGTIAAVPEDAGTTFEVNGRKIAVFRVDGAFYALDDACSHDDASLGEGEVDADELCVACPRHGALFDLETGKARTLPAYKPVAVYKAWAAGDELFIEY